MTCALRVFLHGYDSEVIGGGLVPAKSAPWESWRYDFSNPIAHPIVKRVLR